MSWLSMIEVNRKRGTIILDEPYVGDGSLTVTTHGYAAISISLGLVDGKWKYKKIYLHRYLLPGFEQVDHINGNRLDNRLDNLRGCNNEENNRNKGPNNKNKSGYKGVHQTSSGKWVSQITVNYKCKSLGTFDTAEKAALAYNAAARELHGEFAFQNEVE